MQNVLILAADDQKRSSLVQAFNPRVKQVVAVDAALELINMVEKVDFDAFILHLTNEEIGQLGLLRIIEKSAPEARIVVYNSDSDTAGVAHYSTEKHTPLELASELLAGEISS